MTGRASAITAGLLVLILTGLPTALLSYAIRTGAVGSAPNPTFESEAAAAGVGFERVDTTELGRRERQRLGGDQRQRLGTAPAKGRGRISQRGPRGRVTVRRSASGSRPGRG